jgi:hypothetical protein
VTVSPDRARQIARRTWVSFLLVEAVAILMTLSALADVLFDLGWGYGRTAVLIGVGICLWTAVVWGACRTIFRAGLGGDP